MNLKLSEYEVRLRISSDEFEALQAGKTLRQSTVFPSGNSLCCALEPVDAVHRTELDYAEDGITLRLNPDKLAALADAPAKEGMVIEFGESGRRSLTCVVQVDLRARKRPL